MEGVATPERARLPGRAALIGLAGILAGVALSFVGALVGLVVARHVRSVRLLLAQAGLWTGLVGACVVASRRYGSGRLGQDYGVAARWRDAPVGFVISFLGRIIAAFVVAPIVAANPKFGGTNTGVFDRLKHDKATYLVLAIVATVGAPLVEELFFRGLMMRSLETRLGGTGALLGQSLLFGAAHLNPVNGLGNVAVVTVTATFGVVLGMTARRYGRLGPGMAAHAFFNALPVLVIALR